MIESVTRATSVLSCCELEFSLRNAFHLNKKTDIFTLSNLGEFIDFFHFSLRYHFSTTNCSLLRTLRNKNRKDRKKGARWKHIRSKWQGHSLRKLHENLWSGKFLLLVDRFLLSCVVRSCVLVYRLCCFLCEVSTWRGKLVEKYIPDDVISEIRQIE